MRIILFPFLGGNQYEYQGNDFQKQTYQANSVEESIEAIIVNQEIGRSPLEFFNPLTRAKITDMKNLKPHQKVKNYSSLYQDTVSQSSYHELQKYGTNNGQK